MTKDLVTSRKKTSSYVGRMSGSLRTILNSADIWLIMVLGLFLRLRQFTKSDLWFDEAYTGILMRVPKALYLSELKLDPHPPFYNIAMRYLTNVIGVSDVTLRLPALVFGVLTILFIYLSIKKFIDRETALVAALLVSISPFLVEYSVEARSYSFYGFLGTLALYFYTHRKYWALPVVLVPLLFTHLMAFTVVSAFFGIVFFDFVSSLLQKSSLKSQLPKIFALITVFASLLYFKAYVFNYYGETTIKAQASKEWIRPVAYSNVSRSMEAYLLGVKVKLPGQDTLNDVDFIFDARIWGAFLVVVYFGLVLFIVTKYIRKILSISKSDRNVLEQILAFINNEFVRLTLLFIVPQLLLIGASYYLGNNLYVERYLFPASIFFLASFAYLIVKSLSFEIRAFVVLGYFLLVQAIIPHPYLFGMKRVATALQDFDKEIVFLAPVEYTVGRYYLGENRTLRLYSPEDPLNTYNHWPFIEGDLRPKDPSSAIFVATKYQSVPPTFMKLEREDLNTGDYILYIQK